MRRYVGLRRRNLVADIVRALQDSGGEILKQAVPTTGPFEFTVKTLSGQQRELVCYAFPANSCRRAGRLSDRHCFRIGYASGYGHLHRLYFDPRGKKTTLLFGAHVDMGLFVAVDPRMHSPTWFPRSVTCKTSDLETARSRRWHGWERERSDARHQVHHEESLLTETVIAFQPDQFLRYVEFERLFSGLDCGERCLLSDRIEKGLTQDQSVGSGLGRHPLEIAIGLPVSDILDIVMDRIGRG